jgi:hypothetical protein
MNWRTSHEQPRGDTSFDDAMGAGVADARPVAGPERTPFPGSQPGKFRLGTTLVRELAIARRTRGRFGAGNPIGAPVILSAHPTYPNSRAYVLKLHRDAQPGLGKVVGRLENVTTGEHFLFANANELLACLARDAAHRR